MEVLINYAGAALILVNLSYCIARTIRDFRSTSPAAGVWGLFATGGALVALALLGAFSVVIADGWLECI